MRIIAPPSDSLGNLSSEKNMNWRLMDRNRKVVGELRNECWERDNVNLDASNIRRNCWECTVNFVDTIDPLEIRDLV